MTIDKFHHKVYIPDFYTCAHFVCDVWEHLTGFNIEENMNGLLLPCKNRNASNLKNSFIKIHTPESPCIVLMKKFKGESHVGIYYLGKILHLHEEGVQYMLPDITFQGFNKVSYYKCPKL